MLTRLIWIAAIVAATISVPAFGQSVVGSNTNAVGPFPDGGGHRLPDLDRTHTIHTCDLLEK